MFDGTDNPAAVDEIVAAVIRMQDQRNALLEEVGELRRLLDEPRADDDSVVVHTMALPGGRRWSFVEDAKVLAVSSDLDTATWARLLDQVEAPALMTCGECGAPVWSNATCGMHP